MSDIYKYSGQRQLLVDELRTKGITCDRVLEAVNSVPRHEFMDASLIHFSYEDKAFKIGASQTISQPYTVAFQTLLLELQAGEKVLEIGTGSGYQTAVLLEMKTKVFSIERIKELYIRAGRILSKLGYKAFLHYGDGFEGLPTYGPFNKILITAAPDVIPEKLLKQLKIGGCMVFPYGKETQVMTKIVRLSEDEFETKEFGNFVFVPMLKGTKQ